MPKYGYHCLTHGDILTNFPADKIECPYGDDEHPARRDWRFKVDMPMEPYYSPSFGTVITSRRHAAELAKIKSEEQTARTGIEHHYTLVDTHDDEAVGINKDEKEHWREESRRHAINGATWSKERIDEIQRDKESKAAARTQQEEVSA